MRRSTIKSIAAVALTGAGSALVLGFRTSDPAVTAAGAGSGVESASGTSGTTASGTGSANTGSAGTSSGAAATADTGATTSAAGTGQYADGTYQGTAIEEPWGTFQVQAVISGGKLTNVVLVSSPSDNHSRRINSQAVPILTQGAIAAQGANVDMVSGATWTSDSYVTSLQAALDQAKAAVHTAG